MSLTNENFTYQYGGDKIGGNYSDINLQFIDGGVNYSKVECLKEFVQGIDRLVLGSIEHTNVIIMCAEKDPYFCHRFALISHTLSKKNINTVHILPEVNKIMNNAELEDKMRSEYGRSYSLDELYAYHNWVMFHYK